MAAKTRLILFEQKHPCKLLKWKVLPGSRLSFGTILFHYELVTNEKDLEEKLLKYKTSFEGTVQDLLVKEGDFIQSGTELMTLQQSCSHSIVMKDMCAECGADLRELDSENFKEVVAATSVSMIHSVPELRISEQKARELGRADEERLLKDQKLVLLVDLDQTLIHTTNENIPPDMKGVYHFQLYGARSPWYHTKLRPGTEEFLKKISKLYELHIFTFGARPYAHHIACLMDSEGKLFSHRILSRDECFSQSTKVGNLKALFPCGDSMVCIIDDREDVWNFAPNLVHVKPYHYFSGTGDINSPTGKGNVNGNSDNWPNTNQKSSDSNENTNVDGQTVKDYSELFPENIPQVKELDSKEIESNLSNINISEENQENGIMAKKVYLATESDYQECNSKETMEISNGNSESGNNIENEPIKCNLVENVSKTSEDFQKIIEYKELPLGSENKINAKEEISKDEQHPETENIDIKNQNPINEIEEKPNEDLEKIDQSADVPAKIESEDKLKVDDIEDKSNIDDIEDKSQVDDNDIEVKPEFIEDIKIKSQIIDDIEVKAQIIDDIEGKSEIIDDIEGKSELIEDIKIKSQIIDDIEVMAQIIDNIEVKAQIIDDIEDSGKNEPTEVNIQDESSNKGIEGEDTKLEDKPSNEDEQKINLDELNKPKDEDESINEDMELANKETDVTDKDTSPEVTLDLKKENELITDENTIDGSKKQFESKSCNSKDDEDDYLLYLEEILTTIHKAFYDMYDQLKVKEENKMPDLKTVIPYVRRKVLKNTNIIFSGVIPTNMPPEKNKLWTIAKSLGATVGQDLIPLNSEGIGTTHVVAAKIGTAKVNKAQKMKGIHVVSPDWLWCCAERWEHVDERLFPLLDSTVLKKPYKKNKTEKQPDLIYWGASQVSVNSGSSLEACPVYDPCTGKRIRPQQTLLHKSFGGGGSGDGGGGDVLPVLSQFGVSAKTENTKLKTKKEFKAQEEYSNDSDTFLNSFSPLLGFSTDEINKMGQEVDDACSEESENDTEDTDPDETPAIKKRKVQETETSSEESLTGGELPKGWKKRKKNETLPAEPSNTFGGIYESEDDGCNARQIIPYDSEKSENSESDEFNQSIGSADEEMAAAVEREFLN